ncbi:MspA family porin [Nocardia sp. NPDC005978]|uniref:MspA family porin n=1 Tax=Nocardia sp. NPDC005978 TaxID=3156725 RepID=UPI0033BA4B21
MTTTLVKAVLVVGAAAALTVSPAGAETIGMAPHEKTLGALMVGNREERITRVAPLNMVGTTREVFVGSVAYGRNDTDSPAKLRIGYHMGCAVAFTGDSFGAEPDIYAISPGGDANPTNFGPVAELTLVPGTVETIKIAEIDMEPGQVAEMQIDDFHIVVNACAGPATLRQYTAVVSKTTGRLASAVVYGDSTWM